MTTALPTSHMKGQFQTQSRVEVVMKMIRQVKVSVQTKALGDWWDVAKIRKERKQKDVPIHGDSLHYSAS